VKRPSELMERLRDTLKRNPSIGLEVLMANPAHGVVTEYVNRVKSVGEQELGSAGVRAAPEVSD
jgi:hypothetical protein